MADHDDPVAAFAAEGAALDAFLDGLDAAAWATPSACAGWSVADVVLHLAQSEEGVVSAFDVGDAGVPYHPYVADALAGGDGAVDGIVAAAVEAERPDDPRAALERWRAAHAAVLDRLRAADPSQRVPWITVPLAARTLAATRLSEHWIHGMDIREPLGAPAADTDRLWFVARLAWRTLPYAFAEVGDEAPTVRLRLEAPDGGEWAFGDEAAVVVVEGRAGEWCRLAARRLRPEQTALRASGPGAERVLALARTYA